MRTNEDMWALIIATPIIAALYVWLHYSNTNARRRLSELQGQDYEIAIKRINSLLPSGSKPIKNIQFTSQLPPIFNLEQISINLLNNLTNDELRFLLAMHIYSNKKQHLKIRIANSYFQVPLIIIGIGYLADQNQRIAAFWIAIVFLFFVGVWIWRQSQSDFILMAPEDWLRIAQPQADEYALTQIENPDSAISALQKLNPEQNAKTHNSTYLRAKREYEARIDHIKAQAKI